MVEEIQCFSSPFLSNHTIPLTRVIVDNLYTFLRVADMLIDLLLLELRLDKVEKCIKLEEHRSTTVHQEV